MGYYFYALEVPRSALAPLLADEMRVEALYFGLSEMHEQYLDARDKGETYSGDPSLGILSLLVIDYKALLYDAEYFDTPQRVEDTIFGDQAFHFRTMSGTLLTYFSAEKLAKSIKIIEPLAGLEGLVSFFKGVQDNGNVLLTFYS